MYQHGSPGSAQAEVPNAARGFLGAAGFAVAGFTDPLNRQFPTVTDQQFAILGNVLFNGQAPDFYIEQYAEQMAFVRALQSLANLDVLPLGAPDGIPDLDPSRLVYEGISYGSNHAQAFMAYEPDIHAAALVAGAVRFAELIEYQDRTLPLGGDPLLRVILPSFLTGIRAPDLWMGLHLFAITYDRQDPQNHARFLFREPLEIDGTTQKASLLVVEGIDDSFTSNNSTRSLARQLGGIPQLAPAPIPVPDLSQQAGPIQGNVDATTTAAMVQYVPAGAAVPPTPGCESQFEGHYCAQTAPSARGQRVRFYQSALSGVPVID
jgi:pimeloyl-ACP methyl ester carboxylesterase